MGQKTKQHLVPACYLKQFLADVSDNKGNKHKMQPGVFVNSKDLSDQWKMRGLRHSVFTRNKYYNLPEDNENDPVIEDFLSKVESFYPNYISKLEKRELSKDVIGFFSFFTILQYIRVESFMEPMKETWNSIAQEFYDITGEIGYINRLSDMAKRQIPYVGLLNTSCLKPKIVYNNTEFKFVTSDNPVFISNVNKRDLSFIFPKKYIVDNEERSDESVLIFFPLTPSIAYISCDLIDSNVFIDLTDENSIETFYLNIFLISNAKENVYSSVEHSIKFGQEVTNFFDSIKHKGESLMLQEKSLKMKLDGEVVSQKKSTLTFKCTNAKELAHIKKGDKFNLAKLVVDGSVKSMKRYCSVIKSDSDSGLLVIESGVGLQ